MKQLAWLLLLWPGAELRAAAPMDCLTVSPLSMRVQIGTGGPRDVLLIGGNDPALRVVDAATGEVLWWAGGATASQRFASMSAPFAGGFTALDTDHDGLHDRLYAGDLVGRLWRFDFINGAAADRWSSGGVFADFSNEAGRGFLAAPDVSLATAPGTSPWLHIAIGTAAPGRVEASNRFYVLRDHAPFQAWTDEQYRDWVPLREQDLVQIDSTAEASTAATDTGWFIVLDQGDILSASITVAGRTVFAIADTPTNPAAGCRSAFSIAALALATGQLQRDSGGRWRRTLATDLSLDSAFAVVVGTDIAAITALCSFGSARTAECDVDLGPRRTWWRREDTE